MHMKMEYVRYSTLQINVKVLADEATALMSAVMQRTMRSGERIFRSAILSLLNPFLALPPFPVAIQMEMIHNEMVRGIVTLAQIITIKFIRRSICNPSRVPACGYKDSILATDKHTR